MRQIHQGLRQIEFQLLRGKHHAHVPDALLGERFRLRQHSRRQLVAGEIGHVKTILSIHYEFDAVCGASLRDEDFSRNNGGVFQVAADFRQRCKIPDERMPTAHIVKCADAAKDTIGILLGGDVAQCEHVSREQVGRCDFRRFGEQDIPCLMTLPCKKFI